MTRHHWTADQIAFLEAHYADHRTAWIAERLGMDQKRVYQKANAMGLRKSYAFLSSEQSGRLQREDHRGRQTRFHAGHTPWNKGLSWDSGGRSHETRFKPGHRGGIAAEVYKPVGTERISKDGYLERKIHDDMPLQRRWRAVHLIVWEAANGPLPKGHAVVFRNGDKRDIRLENLELVTRAELMRRNTRHNLPPEINEVIGLRAALVRKINKRTKSKEAA